MTNTNSKAEKFINFSALWISRLCLSILAVAGAFDLLSGVDPTIVYPFAVVGVVLLLKETL